MSPLSLSPLPSCALRFTLLFVTPLGEVYVQALRLGKAHTGKLVIPRPPPAFGGRPAGPGRPAGVPEKAPRLGSAQRSFERLLEHDPSHVPYSILVQTHPCV